MQWRTGKTFLITIGSIFILLAVSCGALGSLGLGEEETPTEAVAEAQDADEIIPTSTSRPTPTPRPTATATEPPPEPTSTGLPTEIIEQISPISPISPKFALRQRMVDQLNKSVEVIPGSEEALAAAVTDLSEQTGLPPDQITLVSMEDVEWRDSSLGCPEEGFMYAQVITPGYKIVLEADGQEYVYHTDQGSNAVLCPA